MIVRHGWTLFALPLFLEQLEKLIVASERARRADPNQWQTNANTKLLASVLMLMLDRIPQDPLSPAFRQGNTLGAAHRHWFRAKFGGNRFRLFYRADRASRIIVFAWVNDRETLRKAGASSDPYAVFAGMLSRDNPPNDWSSLLQEARTAAKRFDAIVSNGDQS